MGPLIPTSIYFPYTQAYLRLWYGKLNWNGVPTFKSPWNFPQNQKKDMCSTVTATTNTSRTETTNTWNQWRRSTDTHPVSKIPLDLQISFRVTCWDHPWSLKLTPPFTSENSPKLPKLHHKESSSFTNHQFLRAKGAVSWRDSPRRNAPLKKVTPLEHRRIVHLPNMPILEEGARIGLWGHMGALWMIEK